MPLTDTAIRAEKPGEKNKRLFDGGGLYLEVTPSGSKRWHLKYRFGTEKRLSFGTYPTTTLKAARLRRDEAKRHLAAGTDPGAVRREEKAARRHAALFTFETVAMDWLEHRSSAWKSGTRQATLASLKNHVFPTIGSRPISEIRPLDIVNVIRTVDDKGAGETAGRVFQRIRSVFLHAVTRQLVAVDPTYSLKPAAIVKPRVVSHRASMPATEMPEFLRKLAAYDGVADTKAALRLLMLTALRPGELRGGRWDEIDVDAAIWRIPAARMKMNREHTVPLSKQALAVLQTLKKHRSSDTLVFPSPYYPDRPISDGTLNSALARMGYKGIATAHGFRTVFSTAANEEGFNRDAIEKQLAHEERDDVRGAYNRAQWLSERTLIMQWWADQLDKVAASRGS